MSDATATVARLRREVASLRETVGEAGAAAVLEDLDKIERAASSLNTLWAEVPRRKQDAEGDPDRLRRLRHDLRTPINQIVGYCELLQEECTDDGHHAWLDALHGIHASGKELSAMVDEVGRGRSRTEVASPQGDAAGSSDALGTVLVVDDNPTNREMLSRRLGRYGYEVRIAVDGREALERVAREPVDVVLLDIMMPVMDGYETLEHLKSSDATRHIPVIMLTSLDETISVAHCIQQGAEDHLPKPFDPVLLRARIEASLERKRLHDRAQEYLERTLAEKKRADRLLEGVIPLGVALSEERDFNRLLERLVGEAKRFCGADGGAVLIRTDEGVLEHVLVQCDSLQMVMGGTVAVDASFPPIELNSDDPMSPVVAAALEGKTVDVADTGTAVGYDLTAVQSFDARFGYETRSLVVLPLRGRGRDVVGVLEMWNATRATDGAVVPFDGPMREILESLSLLAGVALDQYRRETRLRQRIRQLEIQIDEVERRREVSEITETDYFKRLRERAREIRRRSRGSSE